LTVTREIKTPSIKALICHLIHPRATVDGVVKGLACPVSGAMDKKDWGALRCVGCFVTQLDMAPVFMAG
jgi:hypothetical protein